jgi:hypothetical protein
MKYLVSFLFLLESAFPLMKIWYAAMKSKIKPAPMNTY